MRQQTRVPVSSTNGTLYLKTPADQSTNDINSSSFIDHVSVSSSYSNHIFPSHLPLKKLKPESWQRFFNGTNQSKSIDEQQNTSVVGTTNEQSLFDETCRCSVLPTPIQTHIDQLHEQINNLTSQLSDQHLEYKQTRIKTGKILSKQLRDREKQLQGLVQDKLLDHEKELKEREKKFIKLLNEERTENFQREEQLRNELDFVKVSFHAYKMNLDNDYAEKYQTKVVQVVLPIKTEEMEKKIDHIFMEEQESNLEKPKIESKKQRRKAIKTQKSKDHRPRFMKKTKKQ